METTKSPILLALTPTEQRIYEIVCRRARLEEPCPSNRDLMEVFGWKSPSTAAFHMASLERKGFVSIKYFNQGRLIIMLTGEPAWTSLDGLGPHKPLTRSKKGPRIAPYRQSNRSKLINLTEPPESISKGFNGNVGFWRCQYIYGDLRADGFQCWDIAAPKSSYCEIHHALCYLPAE